MSNPLISIIIPVYNEKKLVAAALAPIFSLPLSKEIIIINDGSNDGTEKILEQLKLNHDFKLLHQGFNQGKGAAIKRALSEISGKYFIIHDADGEYFPSDIITLINKIVEAPTEKIAVYGSRFLAGSKMSFHYLVNNFLSALTNILFKSQLTDMETCYKLIPQGALKHLNLSGRRFEIEPEITAQLLKAGYQIIEIPISYQRRGYDAGKKIKARDGLLAIKTLLKERFKK